MANANNSNSSDSNRSFGTGEQKTREELPSKGSDLSKNDKGNPSTSRSSSGNQSNRQ